MVCRLVSGQRSWSGSRDEDGHREYKVKHLVLADYTDGPANVLATPGLPLPGSQWFIDGDSDLWAFCLPTASATIHQEKEGDKNRYWIVEQTFSTKLKNRCVEDQIENPLLEPPKISGSFVKYKEEILKDRFGAYITNSAHEQLRGPQVEFDRNTMTVRIEQNVASIYQAMVLPARMMDTLNGFELWGIRYACIKLSNSSWERKYHGQCYIYYTRVLEFEIDLYRSFEREILDEGTKVLHGEWDNTTGEWVVTRIGGLPKPATPTAVFLGEGTGNIAGGVARSYQITATNFFLWVNGQSLPSNASAPITGDVDINDNAVRITWPATEGATGYYVYGRGTTPDTRKLLAHTTTNSYTDDGTLVPSDALPEENTTGIVPNAANPAHFIRYRDRNDNLARVVLDGFGKPIDSDLPTVITCGECDEGMAQYWDVTGFTGDFALLNIRLEYVNSAPAIRVSLNPEETWPSSTCRWQGDVNNDPNGALGRVILDFVDGSWKLAVANFPDLNGVVWEFNDPTWNCTGTNTLEAENVQNPVQGLDLEIAITSPERAEPGTVFVQVYNYSNFLLLGIPSTL